MNNRINTRDRRDVRRSRGLLISTTIFALLYAWLFITDGVIASPDGVFLEWSPELDRARIFANAMFLVFAVGYAAAWKSELVAAVIFLSWYAAWLVLTVTVFAAAIPHSDAGQGVVMGLPVLIFGILFLARWSYWRPGAGVGLRGIDTV